MFTNSSSSVGLGRAQSSSSVPGGEGDPSSTALALAELPGSAVATCSDREWAQLEESTGQACGSVHGGPASEELQLVLYQQRELVLYDRRHNRAFARQLTEQQADVLMQSKRSFCPLCRKPLDPSWAFVVEGYFEMLTDVSLGATSSASPFSSNEEAAAASGLHSIPPTLLNCGYYARFFVEERRLGSGSFGAVYLCRHVMDEIELGVFAVKKLALGDDTKRLRQVMREVKALERLRHMNIIDYKHSWLEVSRHSEVCPYVPFLFILMEYCNAGALEAVIWPRGFVRGATDNAVNAARLGEETIWHFFLDICCGLRHLHGRGILHRDLKPSNIMLHMDEEAGAGAQQPLPRAMLSDFGTCEILGETSSGGKPAGGYAVEFLAPECLMGEEGEEPADMWSAGLVLYAMCTGDLPYHSDDPEHVRKMVIAHTVLSDLPSFLGQSLRSLVSTLTARVPAARPTAVEAERVCVAARERCEGQIGSPRQGAFSAPKSPLALPEAAPCLELMDGQTETPMALSLPGVPHVGSFPSASSLCSAAD